MRIHHVQVAIPAGGEDLARQFYGDLLDMEELDTSRALQERGGCWFRTDSAEIHCGVEEDFRPAHMAHPGIEVEDLEYLEGLFRRGGVAVTPDDLFPGRDRFYVDDPFGNRLEFLGPERTPEHVRPHPFVVDACYRARRRFGISAPNASFDKGQVVRFVRYTGYSAYDGASVFTFKDVATGAAVDLWWFDSNGLDEIESNLEPVWSPVAG